MNNKLIIAALIAGAVYWYTNQGSTNDPQAEDLVDSVNTKADEFMNGTGPNVGMRASSDILKMMMSFEGFSATPYNLGDGGATWGYGHQGQRGETVPASITPAAAAVLFASDVQRRAEHWVILYTKVDLEQCEFDALVSIAFNMSPQSFKKFAASVNAGNGIDDIAQASVGWVAAAYTNGIQRRRNAEMAVFDDGVYT